MGTLSPDQQRARELVLTSSHLVSEGVVYFVERDKDHPFSGGQQYVPIPIGGLFESCCVHIIIEQSKASALSIHVKRDFRYSYM